MVLKIISRRLGNVVSVKLNQNILWSMSRLILFLLLLLLLRIPLRFGLFRKIILPTSIISMTLRLPFTDLLCSIYGLVRWSPDSLCFDDYQAVDLGGLLKLMLQKIAKQLNDPPYNYMIHTSPLKVTESQLPYTHWFLQIVPQLSGVGGFEIGTGCYINPVFPEDVAKVMREVSLTWTRFFSLNLKFSWKWLVLSYWPNVQVSKKHYSIVFFSSVEEEDVSAWFK